MNHGTFKEWLHLFLAGELGVEENRLLQTHLNQCGECRAESEELQRVVARLQEYRTEHASDELLSEVRQSLHEAIRGEALTEAAISRLGRVDGRINRRVGATSGFAFGRGTGWLGGFRPALFGASALAAGVFIGYLAFGQDSVKQPDAPVVSDVAGEMGGPDIANVRFVDWGSRDGTVEIEYDLVRPVRLRAAVGDDRIQRVLARALLSDENPGVRLRAVGAHDPGAPAHRPEVKLAIIDAVKTDPNAGVRREGLYVLEGMPFDHDVEATCLYVLEHDDNPGMRVASLNLLSSARLSGHDVGPKVYDYLSDTGENDPWVRAQSAVFFEEVKGE